MIEDIKYIWIEFKKKPFLVITFSSLLSTCYFSFLYINTFKTSETKLQTYKHIYDEKLEKKDSIILALTAAFSTQKAINDINSKINNNK